MSLKLGPILSFREVTGTEWRVAALIVEEGGNDPPSLDLLDGPSATSVKAGLLTTFEDTESVRKVWRYDFSVPLAETARKVGYRFKGRQEGWEFHVPEKGSIPNMAYASCTGFSSNKLMQKTKDPYGMVRQLNERHGSNAYHLMMMGGDQVYADSMFDKVPALRDWLALRHEEKKDHPYTAEMEKGVEQFYRNLYIEWWSQPELKKLLATIPTLMMWDDHDIFDGWGSYDSELQRSPVYQGIFRSARRHFHLYQLHLAEEEAHPSRIPKQQAFSLGIHCGPLAILALDMRSERTDSEVLSPVSWKAVYDWLDSLAEPCHHVLIMSSIPVVHPDFSMLEKALSVFPGRQTLEDDLRDQWNSTPHKQERLRLIHRLLDFADKRRCRVTLLSGDVHVGALGVIRDNRAGTQGTSQHVTQLTSSGIIHPPPAAVALFFLEHVAGKEMSTDRDISTMMIPFPGTRHHFIGARNWLALEPDKQRRIWANWHIEDEPHPYTQVIHPLDFEMPKASVGKSGWVEWRDEG